MFDTLTKHEIIDSIEAALDTDFKHEMVAYPQISYGSDVDSGCITMLTKDIEVKITVEVQPRKMTETQITQFKLETTLLNALEISLGVASVEFSDAHTEILGRASRFKVTTTDGTKWDLIFREHKDN